jgi:hypothetical protein
MKRNETVLVALGAAVLLAALMMLACNELPYEGTEKIPIPPSVFWADVPVPPENSSNPVLNWYGTDSDGLILDYQYRVLLKSTVDSLGGPAAVANNFPAGYEWTIVHEDSSTISLYADPDTSVMLPQYVFLKAMDDDSLFSTTIYKSLSRKNHPPTCYVVVPWRETVSRNGLRDPGEPIDPQWCLQDTTSSWRGIPVSWVGKDSIDISGLQPDFEWNIRLYGPFTDTLAGAADTLPAHLYGQYVDADGNPWVKMKEARITNLEKGFYIIYVRNRDDAFVPAIPDLDYLSVFEPTWIRHPEQTRKILLANHTYHPFARRAGELDSTFRDDVWDFYIELLESAGYTSDDYDTITYTLADYTELEPQKSDLYNHELVIALDTDYSREFTEDNNKYQHSAYAKYLDVGGKLWIIGRRSFETGADAGRVEFGGAGSPPLPFDYFNISAVFGPEIATTLRAPEFAGALALEPGFPDLTLDTTRVAQTSTAGIHYAEALFGVSFIIRFSDQSETIYKYNSIYPDTSNFHNFPVAIRYNPGTFKTSCFAFPLYFIRTDQAQAVTQRMLDWFFES